MSEEKFLAVLLPVDRLGDEQVVKFLERNRRRHALYGSTAMQMAVDPSKCREANGFVVLEAQDMLRRLPPLIACVVSKETDHVLVELPLEHLHRWIGPTLRRLRIKGKRRPGILSRRTKLLGVKMVAMYPKHTNEVRDPTLDYTTHGPLSSLTPPPGSFS